MCIMYYSFKTNDFLKKSIIITLCKIIIRGVMEMVLCRTSQSGCTYCRYHEKTKVPSTCSGYQEAKVCLYYLERFVWPDPCDGMDEECSTGCIFQNI